MPVGARMEEVEEAYLRLTLKHTNDNKTRAAEILGRFHSARFTTESTRTARPKPKSPAPTEMNSKAAAILTDPHPYGHIAYPYTDEALVVEAVALFAGAGLRNGEGVILVMTAAHRDAITLRLVTEGYAVESLRRSGRLICINAEDLLAGFMRNGVPDEEIFSAVIEELIAACRAVTASSPGHVRVFGEMVSLLWDSNLHATISLEEMWNRIIDRNSVSLMCAYALNGRHGIPDSLRALHSHSLDCAEIAA